MQTLVVTLPSLYVFNALVGSRLSLMAVVRLLMASIVGFFAICTTSYSFIVLLNVLVYAIAGLLGLKFLLQTLHRMTIVRAERFPAHLPSTPPPPLGGTAAAEQVDPIAPPAPQARASHLNDDEHLGALDPTPENVLGPHTKTVFRIWVLVFGLVGAQMGWILRPFIGDPNLPFQWFRSRESNFFQAVLAALGNLFS
ncbi:MAG TPA: hypothetical protein VGR35_00640 [Tepidisphaeraceae bacterium]|nr:hypothetical protein [Tepidisphaeraceae bacterium]